MSLFDDFPEVAALGLKSAKASRYALPWEEPEQEPANQPTDRYKLPWEDSPEVAALRPSPTPNPQAPSPVVPHKDNWGLLSTLGDVLDRPGNALRGVLAGKPGALKGLVPFSESMGIFGDEDRVSGQEMLNAWGVLDKPSDSLLSGAGLAGLGAEVVFDPLNLAFGLGALTKAGKAAQVVGGGLSAADKALDAMKAGKTLEELALAGAHTTLDSPVAKAGRYLKQTGKPLTLADDWATAAQQGQRAALGIGGDYAPLLVGPSVELPEKVLAYGPEFLRAMQASGGALKALPGVKHVANLFSKTPPGLEGDAARIWDEELTQARKGTAAGMTRAADEAEQLDVALRGIDSRTGTVFPDSGAAGAVPAPAATAQAPIPPTSMRGPAGELIDPVTGEVLQQADEVDEFLKLTPDDELAGKWYSSENPYPVTQLKGFEPQDAAVGYSKATGERAPELRTLEEMALQADLPVGQKVETPRGKGTVRGTGTGTYEVSLKGGLKAEVPQGHAKPIYTPEDIEQTRLAKTYTPEQLKEIQARSKDTRKIIGQGFGHEGEIREKYMLTDTKKGIPARANRELQDRIESQVKDLGYGAGRDEQARALAKSLEKSLNMPEPVTPEMLGLNTIKTVNADAAELMVGDSFTIAGEKFKVLPSDNPEKIRLKDHVEIEVPPELVPMDAGAKIQRQRHTLPEGMEFGPGRTAPPIGPRQALSKAGKKPLLISSEELPEVAALKDAPAAPKGIEQQYQPAGALVDGRKVRKEIPNAGSISSSLDEYEELPGVREVRFEQFTEMGELSYYSAAERVRTQKLAQQIKQSGEISPLIVVIDEKGPYVLEGGHRFDALRELGAKSFPAKVVIDRKAVPIAEAAAKAAPPTLAELPEVKALTAPPPPPTGKRGAMTKEQAQQTLAGLEEADAARLMPEQAAHMKALGLENAGVGTGVPPVVPDPTIGKAGVPDEIKPENLTGNRAVGGGNPPAPGAVQGLPSSADVNQVGTQAARLDAAAKAAGLGGRTDVYNRMRQANQRLQAIQEQINKIPGEEVASPKMQDLLRQRKHAFEEYAYYEQFIKQAKAPPIGPHPTVQEVERVGAQQKFERDVKAGIPMKQYLQAAGVGTRQAAKDAAKLFPQANEETLRKVTQVIEDAKARGVADAKIKEAAEVVAGRYAQMHKIEQTMSVPTGSLKDPRLDYTTRVATKEGSRFFKGLKPNQRAQLFVELMQKRQALGVAEDATGSTVGEIERRIRPENAKIEPLPPLRQAEGKEILARTPEEARAWIEANGMSAEFLAFSKVAENIHPSQIQRLPEFRGLTINELNDVFKKVGARGEVFSSNPAVQMFARTARHVRAKAADDMFKNITARLGKQIPDDGFNRGFAPVEGMPGIEKVRGKGGAIEGYQITAIGNQQLPNLNRKVMLPDLQTAEALQKALAKMLTPEQIHPVLEWYDETTKMLKGWVTKAFPAYHVRNRISNRLQSWLVDVPVAGSHYTNANRLLAGKDVSMKVGSGELLNREQLLEELTDQGILKQGFFESEFEKELGKKSSWNPLKADNKFVKAGERVSSAIAAGPGQVLSGAGTGALKDADASLVEGVDRVGHYLYQRAQGMSPDQAAASVKKALFDYGDLNDFEKQVLGRLQFFYAYTRNAVPFMLERMLHKPAKVRAMTQLSGGAGGPREGLPEHVPTYAREGLPIPLGKDAENNDLMLYGLGTPLEGALEPFAGFAEGAQRGGEKLLAGLNPLIRTPLEAATGRRFFLGKDISESTKAPHWVADLPPDVQAAFGVQAIPTKQGGTRYIMPPEALFALESSPFGRLSTTVGKASDDKKPLAARALNLLTGMKTVSVDPEMEAYYANKDAAKARLKELERKGLIMSPEIFALTEAGKQSEELPELQALLKATKAKAPGTPEPPPKKKKAA